MAQTFFWGFVPRSLICPRFKVIARVKRFVHQQRLGTNKILSNRVKLTSARALETKSVWVFLCSIHRLTRRKRGGWEASVPPRNNLLKFVDFASEKGCKSQGGKNEDSNSYIFEKLPESIQNAISFDVIQVNNCNIFIARPSLVVILCLRQWQIFQKWGVFQRSKGRGHEKFSRGQAPRPPSLLASLATMFQPPPNLNFLPTGL